MTERPQAVRDGSDEALMAEFQAGQEAAFDELVRRYKDPLINFAYRFLGDEAEADDVVQEVFVRVYRKKNTYRPVARFSTWIYTIAKNLSKTELRRRRRHAMFSLTPRDPSGDPWERELPDSRYSADLEAERISDAEFIQRALDTLNPKYREVIVLSDIQELTYEEIAEVTGLNIGTVKSRLNRGRTKLQQLLQHM